MQGPLSKAWSAEIAATISAFAKGGNQKHSTWTGCGFFGRDASRTVTVNYALENMLIEKELNDKIQTVTVKRDGKYKRVIAHNQ
jgi:hypothetical protein